MSCNPTSRPDFNFFLGAGNVEVPPGRIGSSLRPIHPDGYGTELRLFA